MRTLKIHSALLLMAQLGLSQPGLAAPAAGQSQDDPRVLMFHARAKQLRAGGDDPTGAVALYRRVIALEPKSSEAYLHLSEALAETGDLEAALPAAVKATELNRRSADAWFNLGVLQFQKAKSPGQARAAFEEASHLLPGDPEVWYNLALINQSLGDKEGELKAWVALGRLHPSAWLSEGPLEIVAWEHAAGLSKDLDRYETRREAIMALGDQPMALSKDLRLLEELAREQADKGFLGHAEESFLLLGRHFPQEPAIWENVAHIQMQTGRYDEALASLDQAASLKPSPRYTYFESICLMNLGRLKEAEGKLRSLLAGDTSSEATAEMLRNARYFLATTVLMQGRPAEVPVQLQGWPGSGDQGDLAALRLQCLIQTQNWKAAKTALDEGLKRFSDEPFFKTLQTLPPAFLKEGSLKTEARQALVQLDQEAMAALWVDFRQWEKALDAARKSRTGGPLNRIEPLMTESSALDQLGRPLESIQALRDAQKLDPQYPMLQNNLGYMLLENGGDLEEASRLIQSALTQSPKNGSTVDSWGWVLYREGKLKEAEEALRSAVELTPFSPEIRMHLGEVLLKQDRPQEALEQWERALAYAFPARKELERRVEELRTRLAKERSAHTTEGEAPASDDSNDEDTP